MSDPQATRAAASAALRADFSNLLNAAEREAMQAVDRVKRAHRGRYLPSRMNRAALEHLTQVFRTAYVPAIESRLAQLDRVNRKLARIDPDWTLKTTEDLRRPPATLFRGGLA